MILTPNPARALSTGTALFTRVALAVALASGVASMAQPQPRVSLAAAESEGPSWQSLSAEQRATLAPLQNEWASMDAARKAKWLGIAARYERLPLGEQQRLQNRMTEWSRMTPSERARARLNYKEAQQLPHRERQDQWEAYKALPEDQRRALADRARARAERRGARAAAVKAAPEPSAKRNIVPNPSHSGGPTRTVAPAVVQPSHGATTTLVTNRPMPPAHHQAGMPKIAATPGFVERNTLLPTRGPQVAGVRAAASAPARKP